MNDQPTSALDIADRLSPDWGLVVFALLFVAVGAWLVWKYGDDK